MLKHEAPALGSKNPVPTFAHSANRDFVVPAQAKADQCLCDGCALLVHDAAHKYVSPAEPHFLQVEHSSRHKVLPGGIPGHPAIATDAKVRVLLSRCREPDLEGTVVLRSAAGRAWGREETDRVRFRMAHLDSVSSDLRLGDTITAGTQVGTVGNSGNARGTAPHLHFSIYLNGRYQNSTNPFPRLMAALHEEEMAVA